MNHVVTESSPGELGRGCKCGQRFPTLKAAEAHAAEAHAADQNLMEENEAKAAHAAQPDVQESKPEPASSSQSAESEDEAVESAAPPEAPKADPELPQEPLKPQAPAPVPAEAPQALSPSNLPLDLENLSLNQINFIGQTMAKSGMFPDVNDGAKALVKILAGKEIGVTPFQAMTNIHIIQGKATMGANLMAAKVKGSGKYDYRVMDLTNETCSILFKQRDPLAEGGWADLGKFTYSLEDAKRAGLVKTGSSWEKYPSNMLFARAISSGVRIYCPDVFNGNLVYVPEELGAQVNEDGEPVGKAA
jgi:predicted  nucleic acid-binding Zn-ribbon protein